MKIAQVVLQDSDNCIGAPVPSAASCVVTAVRFEKTAMLKPFFLKYA